MACPACFYHTVYRYAESVMDLGRVPHCGQNQLSDRLKRSQRIQPSGFDVARCREALLPRKQAQMTSVASLRMPFLIRKLLKGALLISVRDLPITSSQGPDVNSERNLKQVSALYAWRYPSSGQNTKFCFRAASKTFHHQNR